MANLRPRLRLAVLCAYTEPDADKVPCRLNFPTHTIRASANERECALYIQLENASGEYELTVEIRNERGEVVNPNEPRVRRTFAGLEHLVVPCEFEFRTAAVFPKPGQYFFHVLCDGRSLNDPASPDDRPFPPSQLTVLG
jgi:hypothetical protein